MSLPIERVVDSDTETLSTTWRSHDFTLVRSELGLMITVTISQEGKYAEFDLRRFFSSNSSGSKTDVLHFYRSILLLWTFYVLLIVTVSTTW